MTTRNPPQCSTCAHWIPGIRNNGTQSCAAFPLPGGVPDDIWWNEFDHRQPHSGDHGVQWEPADDGEPYPDWALARSVVRTTPEAEDDELMRMAVDGDEFQAYWTRGKGLKRWSTHPHPWETLHRLLLKHPGIRDAEGLASHYFHVVFGIWPGERKGNNPVGPG